MKKQAIVVLSGGISKNGKIPFFVKNRLNEAHKAYNKGISNRIILSGKWSYLYDDELEKTEASAMASYLESIEVPRKNILLEEKSKDLITSAYYVRKLYLSKRRLFNILLIGSDFQEERASFVYQKILGPNYSISFSFVPSQLHPEILWDFFTYERHTLLKTKAFLRKMKKGDLNFLKEKFFKSGFYQEKSAGYLRKMVENREIGKKEKDKTHYSLVSVYKKRKEIFEKFSLQPIKRKTLKADFWSGRYLNFIGKNKDNNYFCLKLGLKPKDKKQFLKEIQITEVIRQKNLGFAPDVVSKNLTKAPIWYLYKVVSGRTAGSFSTDFSFKDRFYQDFTRKKIIKYLKRLRSIKDEKLNLSEFDTRLYKKRFLEKIKLLSSYKKLSKSKTVQFAKLFFINNVTKLKNVPLYVSHNDLHPGNIIFSSSKKRVYFIDFEHTRLNNIAFDFCFIYLFSWNNTHYQKEFYDQFINSLDKNELQQFLKIFPIVYCFFLIWFLDFLERWKQRSDKERYKKLKKYIFQELKKIVKN